MSTLALCDRGVPFSDQTFLGVGVRERRGSLPETPFRQDLEGVREYFGFWFAIKGFTAYQMRGGRAGTKFLPFCFGLESFDVTVD